MEETYIIHVQVIGGNKADIEKIGQAMREFKNSLPFRLEAIVTNENINLKSMDQLIIELVSLKREIETNKKIKKEEGEDELSNLQH